MDAFTGFEPQIGEILALRTFRIGAGGWLYPLFSEVPWVEGTNTARCNVAPTGGQSDAPPDQTPHQTPEPDCTCGYYAYGSEAAASEHPHSRHVLAVVACWGGVIAGTHGIRAEHARVEALWMSPTVPADLAAAVSARYPSTAVFADKATMLAEHPPTPLDCYEAPTPRQRVGRGIGLRLAIVSALVVGILPADWIWRHHDARLIWALELGLFVFGAVILRITRADVLARGTAVLFAAVALWLVAPFAGVAGTLLLRLPLLQVTILGVAQRAHIVREAARFPARIGPRAA
jgi:hypothetical protein